MFTQVKLKKGGEIMIRSFARFNGSLWDDIFAEIGPLTQRDVIIVNFGAWYPRFNVNELRVSLSNSCVALCPCFSPLLTLCSFCMPDRL